MSTCLAGSLFLLLAGFSGSAQAADKEPTGELWETVSDRTLDDLRGGFDLGAGLLVSFGITRSVYINGELSAQTSLNFGQLAGLNSAQAAQLGRQLGALNLVVQTGPGNSISPDALGVAFATIIQNSLNNQQIIQQTVINASSNALGLLKNMNIQATVNDALAHAIGGR
ncbi:hypothetical protein [Polaromonas sp. SM01]|uniref:hypothetical protein n=1 Tax=Polaromonas sp. SM01 TaxID=3085630 RepID=UPI002982AE87|nr:hypothetical protein [Polaromonas sp. SM01]MDW5443154.1 hypothetical protein [Polaromonas sp. SM01]